MNALFEHITKLMNWKKMYIAFISIIFWNKKYFSISLITDTFSDFMLNSVNILTQDQTLRVLYNEPRFEVLRELEITLNMNHKRNFWCIFNITNSK